MTRTSSFPTPLRRMLAGLTAGVVALSATVLGAALPASAADTATISGTVTSSLDGEPIAGVRVELYAFEAGGFGGLGSVTTDAEGAFTVVTLSPGQYTLGFFDDSSAHLSTYLGQSTNLTEADLLTVELGDALVGADAVLQRAGSVSGTVTDSVTGEPVEGVEVRGEFFDGFGGWVGNDLTGSDGTYQLDGLKPGENWTIYFDASSVGYASEYYDDQRTSFGAAPVTVTAAQDTAGIDAALDAAVFVGGTVELAGNPGVGVEGAEVWLFDEFGSQYTATTDADGFYSFGGLPPGSFTARAAFSGAVTEWWNNQYDANEADPIVLTAGQVLDDLDFSLSAGGTITGVVTGPSGEPLEGVLVEASPNVGAEALSTVTDATGSYTLTGTAPVPYFVSFTPPATENLRSQYYPGVDSMSDATIVTGLIDGVVSGISVQLPVGAIISGTVTAEQSGDPIEGVEVTLSSEQLDLWRYAQTDAAGDWALRGLPGASDWVVEFSDMSGTYLREFYDDQVDRRSADEITLVTGAELGGVDAALTEAATLSGRVVDGDGERVAGAEVWLAPGGALRDLVRATTDDAGEYQFTGLRPGSYRLLAGGLGSYEPQFRAEWFDSVYDPAASSEFSLESGEERVGFDIEILPVVDPELPGTPTIDVVATDPDDVRVEFGLPDDGATPYGVVTTVNIGFDGDGLTLGAFDDLEYRFADEWSGLDAHALVSAQAFGADGSGPAVRTLVEIGDGPGYRVRPVVTVDAADGSSADVSWSIPARGAGIEYWVWDLYTVGQAGEPYVQSGFAQADSPFAHDELLEGLAPGTEYELFVLGISERGENTFWGRTLVTTTAGPSVPGLSASPTPTIAGGPRLGGTLTATVGTWGPSPVALQVQWLRDGVPIPGATAITYRPAADDLGHTLSVRVTGSKPGYLTQARTSVPTRPVIDLASATPERLAGEDRYATAAAISAEFEPGVPVVYLATGRGFPDALSAAAAAATLGGPLLITEPTSLPSVIATELERLDPARVVLVGGPAVVSTEVEDAVRDLLPGADVVRTQGADRYATSREIARTAFSPGDTRIAYIATGRNFPDALAASAAAGADGAPVILVNGAAGSLDSATRELLVELEVQRVFIAGGTGVVSPGIESGLRALLGTDDVRRLAGADRYLTAVAINTARFGVEPTVYLATGLDFPDALAGAALAGLTGSPLYVVPGTCVPTAVLDGMARHSVQRFVKFGGEGVLTAGVEQLQPC